MGALFTRQHRATANGGEARVHQRLFALTPTVYFELGWLGEDNTTAVRVRERGNIGLYDLAGRRVIEAGEFAITDFAVVVVFAERPSERSGDSILTLDFIDGAGETKWSIRATFDAFQLDLLADFDRDGRIDGSQPASEDWTWGTEGRGAVLLVNSDRDDAFPHPRFRDRRDRIINGPLDIEDMARVVISLRGPADAGLADCTIRLHVSDAAASRLRVFDVSRPAPEAVIGPGIPTAIFPAPLGERPLALEGLDYPDAGFSGIITMAADVECRGEVLGSTGIVMRVAPWLALPNTQSVRRLYIAEMEDRSNAAAIRDIGAFAEAAGVPLEIVPPKINRDDRWMQDEMEIGYASTPTKVIPVVLDSPRNRELDRMPEEMLLGPDFGYVTRGNDRQASSLDSFGNLDCCPPHDGPSGKFPFGRILFGGSAPGASAGRRMMKVVRDFVYAQIVQHPIELYSDWLNVGHVDEFLTFLPAPDAPGFCLVLSSPGLGLAVLAELSSNGHGDLELMAGKRTAITVDEVLGDPRLVSANEQYQRNIDWNRNRLVEEIGLPPSAVKELPALYRDEGGRAGSLFPNMINMQVANGHLAIPKPFGPEVNGTCPFEAYAVRVARALGLTAHFVDTYEGYFLLKGEIHCGTNVVREPFAEGWWTCEPSSENLRLGRLIL